MVWAAPYLPVPKVVGVEHDAGTTALITEALPGPRRHRPVLAERSPSTGAGARRGAGRLPRRRGGGVVPVPVRHRAALEHVRRRVDAGLVDPALRAHPEHRHLTATTALARLEQSAPETEDLVVCHGDYCPPNALLVDGKVTGYVDLGELGVADRWRDIAVGGWSKGWNFGTELEPLFYDSYGIEPDPDRIAFYRLLWECVS